MSEFNADIWRDEINNQIIKRLGFVKFFYSGKERELENEIEKHKYFAFRVDGEDGNVADDDERAEYAAQPAKSLVSTIKQDILGYIKGNIIDPYEPPSDDWIEDTLKCAASNTVAIFFSGEMRLQTAYDIDYLAHSIVGDVKYKIGLIPKETP